MLKLYILGIPVMFASLFGFFNKEMTPFEKNMEKMDGIINSSIKLLNKRYGVEPIGRGGSEKDGKSNMESVSFNLYRKISKDEARILIVEIVELLLYNINNNQKITDFLYNNPFTYKNFQFRVFIYNQDASDTYHPDLGLVSLTFRGTVNFVTYESGRLCNYATDVEEPYEEAYKIATGKDYPNSIPKAS